MLEILPAEFDDVIASYDVVIMHFWADWNGYDRTMRRLLDKLETVYKELVFVGSIDFDRSENWPKAKELGVLNIPAVASFVNAKHYETIIGLNSLSFWEVKFQEWIAAARSL